MPELSRSQKRSTILILTLSERKRFKKALPLIYVPRNILNYENLNQKLSSPIICKAFVMFQLKKGRVLEPGRYFANLYCGRNFKRFFDGEITNEDIYLYVRGEYTH